MDENDLAPRKNIMITENPNPYASLTAFRIERPKDGVSRTVFDGPNLNAVGAEAHAQIATSGRSLIAMTQFAPSWCREPAGRSRQVARST